MTGPARRIMIEVAAKHGVPVVIMFKKVLRPDRSAAKTEAIRRVRDELGYSFQRIAKEFRFKCGASARYRYHGGK